MANNDFKITFVVDQTANEVFNAIKNVRGWWSEELEGCLEVTPFEKGSPCDAILILKN